MRLPGGIDLPANREPEILRRHGDEGRAWLDQLPSMIETYAARWEFEVTAAVETGWPTNVILRVKRGDTPLIFKTGMPNPELFTEIYTLARWRGRPGCVGYVEADEAVGVVLLEQVEPGTMLRSAADRTDEVITLFHDVPLKASDEDIERLPKYAQWLSGAFERYTTAPAALPAFNEYIDTANRLSGNLLAVQDLLIHGDLHHENILLGESGWIAIDPKGVIGSAEIETGRFMHNFIGDETDLTDGAAVRDILLSRARMISQANQLDEGAVLAAGFVDLVLGTTWFINDGDEPNAASRNILPVYLPLVADQAR